MHFRLSWLRLTSKTDSQGRTYRTFEEKGADTYLTTDLIRLTSKDAYDTAIIVSSDGDYAPTVASVKADFGKQAKVVYFDGRKPLHIEGIARMRLFRKAFLREHDNL